MKKLLIILLALVFFAGCKSKENAKDEKTEVKSKDDYQKESSEFDKKATENNEISEDKSKMDADDLDEDGNSKADVETINGQDDSEGLGWPQNERDGFVKSCVREATKGGMGRAKATNYCDCMLEKMEGKFPDIQVAAKLTAQDVNDFSTKYAAGCLK